VFCRESTLVMEAPVGFGSLFGKNATLTGGPTPICAYIEQALPDVLQGRINPGKVFDSTVTSVSLTWTQLPGSPSQSAHRRILGKRDAPHDGRRAAPG
jgi:hypothetical protein